MARTYIKTLDRLKVSNLAGRLIAGIDRVIPPDTALFHEAVVRAGAPAGGQPLRYLPYNRQIHSDGDVTTTLSLVVLFNNLRMERFFLKGFREKLSRLVFKFSFNIMDRFIRSVRLDRKLLQIMAGAAGEFSIMGIVQQDEIVRRRFIRRRTRLIYPLMLVSTSDAASRDYIGQFERHQAIRKIKIPLLPFYRKGPQNDKK
ncbi:hypothetical protein DSCW_31570 [Desulfosarcina widdelii]|uniref:Uncharacterized protein n=1 Tax=Desulfosarcina widdelii TaxID=947919 RepID=A0A5K7Z4W5_9BACT|nr:hypothetical protein [Desulfosarcina widdelii]BBO75740.1 hypothetical protein DSCW_31570 [Desulfosarcina widdelii]